MAYFFPTIRPVTRDYSLFISDLLHEKFTLLEAIQLHTLLYTLLLTDS